MMIRSSVRFVVPKHWPISSGVLGRFLCHFRSSLLHPVIPSCKMASAYPDEKEGKEVGQEPQEVRKIRITLTSTNVAAVEKVCADFIQKSKDKKVRTKGPVRIPTKTLRITTRKTPCGEGSKTWDRFQMRIHKRVIDLFAVPKTVKEITNITIEPGVEVEVSIEGK